MKALQMSFTGVRSRDQMCEDRLHITSGEHVWNLSSTAKIAWLIDQCITENLGFAFNKKSIKKDQAKWFYEAKAGLVPNKDMFALGAGFFFKLNITWRWNQLFPI